MFPNLLEGALLLALLIHLSRPAPFPAGVWLLPRDVHALRLLRFAAVAFAVGVAMLLFAAGAANAQTATTVTNAPAEPIQLGPFVTIWAPFVNAIAQNVIGVVVAAAFSALLPFVPSFLKSYFTTQARAVVTSAVQTAAGNVLAKVEGNIATMSFNIGNPLVRQMVQWVISTGAADGVKKLQLSPDDVAEKIVAEIGKLQAKATPASPAT